ncbi:MAG: hypothetical protein AAGJ46_13565 [Planctomycetota bacterium]
MPRSLLILAALFPVLVGHASSQETLRWKFNAGDELRYAVVQTTDLALTSPGGGAETKTRQAMDLVWKVESVDGEGAARVKCEVERVQMTLEASGGQSFEFDTDSPEPPEGLAALVAPAFKQLVTDGFTATFSADGELSDVEASADLLQAVSNLPGGGGSAGAEALRQLAAPATQPLPAEPVAAGGAWTHTSGNAAVAMMGKVLFETKYTYAEQRDVDGKPLAVLTPAFTVTTGPDAAAPQSGKVEARGAEGELLFDAEAGRLASSDVTQKMGIELTVGGSTVSGDIAQQTVVTADEKCEPLVTEGAAAATSAE